MQEFRPHTSTDIFLASRYGVEGEFAPEIRDGDAGRPVLKLGTFCNVFADDDQLGKLADVIRQYLARKA